MKKLLSIIYVLTLAVFIVGCGDGDPGPEGPEGAQGPQGSQGVPGNNGVGFEKRGFFEGTVTGTRIDGTPFTENFKYEYGPQLEGFRESEYSILPSFYLNRYLHPSEGGGFIEMMLEGQNLGQTNPELALQTQMYYPFYFGFVKEMSSNSLFHFYTSVKFNPMTHVLPIQTQLNQVYKFRINSNGQLDFFETKENGVDIANIRLKDGGVVSYRLPWNDNGAFVRIKKADGTVNTSDPTYDPLRLSHVDGHLIFMNSLSDANLSELLEIPADTYTITNVNYNDNTGRLSFDFTINIGAYGRNNTTAHQLTITGKFDSVNGKVFKRITSRNE